MNTTKILVLIGLAVAALIVIGICTGTPMQKTEKEALDAIHHEVDYIHQCLGNHVIPHAVNRAVNVADRAEKQMEKIIDAILARVA